MLTSTPSSPVYPQRVILQSGTPKTVANLEVMKVSLLRSSFSPSRRTRDMDGPNEIARKESWGMRYEYRVMVARKRKEKAGGGLYLAEQSVLHH